MKKNTVVATAVAIAMFAGLGSCKPKNVGSAVSGDAAAKVYVAPGKYDEYYNFVSGGFSGQLSVYGIPSGRLLRVIPVFSVDPEKGWGYSEETKPMLNTSHGEVPWDDLHHVSMSQTNGEIDGRWVFANGNNTPPDDKNGDVPINTYKENFKGTISFISIDKDKGNMDIAFQLQGPGVNFDLSHAGKAKSHGWFFFSCYNTELANTLLEVNASKKDKDFIMAVNWKKAEELIKAGNYKN